MIGRTQLPEVEANQENQTAQTVLADEMAIHRVVDEIDNATDAKDWIRARVFFIDELDTDFVSLDGGEPAKITADALIEAWKTNLFAAKKTCHLRSNHSITVDGDRAEVFSKAYAFNLLETGDVTGLWEVWGKYTHALEKTADGWKCSAMKLDVIYQRGDERVRRYVPQNK